MKHRQSRFWWSGYAIAAWGTVIAAAARWALGEVAYITFLPVVFIAAMVGGEGPGLLATALSLVAGNLLFLEPFGRLSVANVGQALGMGSFAVISVTISILAGRYRRKSQALLESEARLRMALHIARIGTFELNVQTGVTTWSPETEEIYGLVPGTFAGTESAWERMLHPGDRIRARTAVERALQTFEPDGCEWRVVWPDGSIHWIETRFQAFKDYRGKPHRLVGVDIDVTDREKFEHQD